MPLDRPSRFTSPFLVPSDVLRKLGSLAPWSTKRFGHSHHTVLGQRGGKRQVISFPPGDADRDATLVASLRRYDQVAQSFGRRNEVTIINTKVWLASASG